VYNRLDTAKPLRSRDKEAAIMVRWNKVMVIVLVYILMLAATSPDVRARTEGTWGFESGTWAGWTVVSDDLGVDVTGADDFETPKWGSYMAVLGQPRSMFTGLESLQSAATRLSSTMAAGKTLSVRSSIATPTVPNGSSTIRREFTANMRHFVFSYSLFGYGEYAYGKVLNSSPSAHFSFVISTLDGSIVIESDPTTVLGVSQDMADMRNTGVSVVDPTTRVWTVVDVDLSNYLYQQLVIEFSLERVYTNAAADSGTLQGVIYPTWVYVDVDHQMPIVSVDMMPEVRFILPVAPGATVAGTSMDVTIEATDDQSIAEIRLLVNGTLAGQSMVPGRQTFHVSLQEGMNTLQAIATDSSGKQAMVATTVVADSRGPIVALDLLPPGKTTAKMLTLSGSVQDAGSGIRSLTVAGTPVAPDLTGAFIADVLLVRGTNDIIIEAIDNLGNATIQAFNVTYGGVITAPSSTYVVLTIGSRNMEVNGLSRRLDAAPFIKDGRTLLPIRALIEALGGSVQWNPSARTATTLLGSRTVALTIGSTTALVNGSPITLDVAPEIRNGRTFLPLRALVENLGLDLAWEPISQTISLTYWP
jgi:hypothetical protein